MLSNLVPGDARAADKAAGWLVKSAVDGLEGMVDDLFGEAFAGWVERSLERFSDDEICCTVVFFDCCERVLDGWESIMHVSYGDAQPTREMRAGRAHPKKAVIPDLSLHFGRITIRIEAKRLALGQELPKKYVQEGMRRFIDGKYSSTHGKPGYMLGYIVRDETDEIIASVNRAVAAENDLAVRHELIFASNPQPRFACYVSTHATNLRIIHNLFDLR